MLTFYVLYPMLVFSSFVEGLFICLFAFGTIAPSGPGPPHSRGF